MYCVVTELVVQQVNFAYNDATVLRDVSLTMQPGSLNLLVGPSGSGKSTLLKLLAGLYPTFSGGKLTGQLTLDGYEIHDIVPFQRVAHIGYLFQNPTRQFVMKTPFEELRFSLENLQVAPEDMTSRIEDALTRVGMRDFMWHDLMTLSGGEKQKVALAAVLAADSHYLLLDEPFANVDPTSRLQLIQLIKAYQQSGKTILIADHDWSGYTDVIDDVFVMADGGLHTASTAEKTTILSQLPTQPAVHTTQPDAVIGDVVLDQVTLTNGDRPLLSKTSLTIPNAKRTLITGPNGVGKSTLFSALVKLYPYGGQILYQNQSLTKRRIAQHVRDVALVFQNAEQQFIAMTMAEELAQAQQMSRFPELWTSAVIDDVLTRLNLAHVRDHIVYQLSGGQQKKLQVLLMLMTGTPVLLFDEPLAGLDSVSQAHLLAIIAEMTTQQAQTVVMISHQLHAVTDWFDYHLQFEDQTLTFRGDAS